MHCGIKIESRCIWKLLVCLTLEDLRQVQNCIMGKISCIVSWNSMPHHVFWTLFSNHQSDSFFHTRQRLPLNIASDDCEVLLWVAMQVQIQRLLVKQRILKKKKKSLGLLLEWFDQITLPWNLKMRLLLMLWKCMSSNQKVFEKSSWPNYVGSVLI